MYFVPSDNFRTSNKSFVLLEVITIVNVRKMPFISQYLFYANWPVFMTSDRPGVIKPVILLKRGK